MMMVNWHTVKGAIHKQTKYDTRSVYSIKRIFGMEYHIILINLFYLQTMVHSSSPMERMAYLEIGINSRNTLIIMV